jgi:hypothetical protein
LGCVFGSTTLCFVPCLTMCALLISAGSLWVGRWVYLNLTNFPLQMWTVTLWSKRCLFTVHYINDEETRAMDDPSGFMCIVCSQYWYNMRVVFKFLRMIHQVQLCFCILIQFSWTRLSISMP